MCGGSTMMEVNSYIIDKIYQNYLKTMYSQSCIGLTLLLPYIISTRSHWSACQLRVFCTANAQEEVEKEREW